MGRRGRVEEVGLLLLLLLVHWLTAGPALAQVRHPLPVLWMMPVSFGSGGQNLTAGVGPAVRLALQDLREQPPPLGNYELQLQLLDSQCDPAKSLKALFDAMWAGPKYLLVFGGVCPSVTALVARALPALSLVQVSFAATSPSLSNRKWFGNLFSTVPSDRALNQAAVKLLQRHRWTRVGVVTQEGPRRSQMKKDLLRQLQRADVQVVLAESLSEDVCGSLKKLKDEDVRIFVALFEEDSASEVFCCAYRLNLFGARFQWIIADGGTAGWQLGWRESGCTASSLLTAADGSIRLQIRPLSNANTPGVSGRTPQDYQDSYLKQLVQEGSEFSPLHAFAYDTVWVAARALIQVTEAARLREKYGARGNVTVGEEESQRMLLEAVKNSRFEGVTGTVSFRNGERVVPIELVQFQGSSGVLVGEFSTATQQLRLVNQLLRFKGPGPARDRTLERLQRQHVNLLLFAVVSSVAAVTILFALSVLCFITICRPRPRGGSQDQLLLLGVLLSSSSVLVSGLDGASVSESTFEILCSVRLWTLSVGHTVGFAVLLTKTWRVYSASRITPEARLQRAGYVVLWLFLLDVFVLTSWQILDPLRRVVLHHRLQRDPVDQDAVVRLLTEHCSSSSTELWLMAVCGYKGPLLGLGCFLAWSTRSVQTDHHKHLALSVFAVAIFSVSGLSGSLLTSHNPPVQICVSGALVLGCNICVLSSLFGPTILHMQVKGSELQGEAVEEEEEEEVEEEDQLSRLNRQLKSRTAQLSAEIETITKQLSETPHHVTGTHNAGEVRAQVCVEHRRSETEASSPGGVNSPEHVRRRLSVQLPILHHSYLPAIGGVSSSSSSLFGSCHAFVHHNVPVTTSCPPDDTPPHG